jgi:hypothetical protein
MNFSPKVIKREPLLAFSSAGYRNKEFPMEGRYYMSTAPNSVQQSERKVVRIHARPTPTQHEWLARGLDQPGGKLPLFDANGKRVAIRTIRSCIDQGWADPWFANPLKPSWLVCKITPLGREILTCNS